MTNNYKYGTMEGYHGDEHLTEDNTIELKTVHSMTLADISGEDHSLWLGKNSHWGYDLCIENDDCEVILHDKQIHPYAIESLALFCKRFLDAYANHCDKDGL